MLLLLLELPGPAAEPLNGVGPVPVAELPAPAPAPAVPSCFGGLALPEESDRPPSCRRVTISGLGWKTTLLFDFQGFLSEKKNCWKIKFCAFFVRFVQGFQGFPMKRH